MGATIDCVTGLTKQFLETKNGALVNFVCSPVYDDAVRRGDCTKRVVGGDLAPSLRFIKESSEY